MQPSTEEVTHPSDPLLSEQVAPRRTISDPVVSPRERKKRAPTPFPTFNVIRKAAPPSRIPRFAPQRSREQRIEIIKNKKPGLRRVKKGSNTSLKTTFYPKQQPSTTTVCPPRQLVFTPTDDEADRQSIFTPPPPAIRSQREARLYQPPAAAAPPKPVIICRGLDSDTSPRSRPSSSRRPSRGKLFDNEGYIQGPHSTHNKYIDLYGRPPRSAQTPSCYNYEEDRDRGDCISRGGLPPLPPVINGSITKRPTSKSRITTAIIPQGNTFLEGTTFYDNPSRGSTRSELLTAQLFPPSTPPRRQGFIPNFSATSLLSRVHKQPSVTNLHKKLYSDTEIQGISSNRCPLCEATKGRQCHLHHRTMCSRYLTDLEWRICHAVNIYVYKNGEEGQTPMLVHIPPAKKKNMKSVMSIIQERITYPIGYAKYLYRMNGKKVTSPCELEMYNNYVVASNYDKVFKPVCYARRKSPLLVLAKESKHVRELRLKNYQYELYLAKKRALEEERPVEDNSAAGDAIYQTIGTIFPPPQHAGQQEIISQEIPCTFKPVPAPPKPKKKQRVLVECMSSYRPQPPAQEFIVQNCTISTAPLKQPASEVASNAKESDLMMSGRFRSIANDKDSVFYTSRKPSKGVVDAAGGKTIFYQDQQQVQQQKPGGDSDIEEIHKGEYDPMVYSALEDSEAEGYFTNVRQNNPQQLSQNSATMQSQSTMYEGTGDGQTLDSNTNTGREGTARGSNERQMHAALTQQQTVSLQDTQFVSQDQARQMTEEQNSGAISAPSRSYTIITPQAGMAYSMPMSTTNPDQVVYRVSGMQPTVAPPSHLALHEPSGTVGQTNVSHSKQQTGAQYAYSGTTNNGDSGQNFAGRNQNVYSYYDPLRQEFYQTITPQPQQDPGAINPRVSYGTVVMDSNGMLQEGSRSFYSTDEVDIPYSPPMQQRAFPTSDPPSNFTHYQAIPYSVSNRLINPRSGFPTTDSRNNNNSCLIAIRKPSKRNVAIQMGEPSGMEEAENNGFDNLQTARYVQQAYYGRSYNNPLASFSMTPRQAEMAGQQSRTQQSLTQQQAKHQQLYQQRQQMIQQQRFLQMQQQQQQQQQVAFMQQQIQRQANAQASQQANYNNRLWQQQQCRTQIQNPQQYQRNYDQAQQPHLHKNNFANSEGQHRLEQQQQQPRYNQEVPNHHSGNQREAQDSSASFQYTVNRSYTQDCRAQGNENSGHNGHSGQCQPSQAPAHGSTSGAFVPPPTRYRDGLHENRAMRSLHPVSRNMNQDGNHFNSLETNSNNNNSVYYNPSIENQLSSGSCSRPVVSNCGPGGQKWPQPIWKLARTGFSDLVGPDSAPSRIDPD